MIDKRHIFLLLWLSDMLQRGVDLFAVPDQDNALEYALMEAAANLRYSATT